MPDIVYMLVDSIGNFKWEPHEIAFIESIKNMQFQYLGARQQDRANELYKRLEQSH